MAPALVAVVHECEPERDDVREGWELAARPQVKRDTSQPHILVRTLDLDYLDASMWLIFSGIIRGLLGIHREAEVCGQLDLFGSDEEENKPHEVVSG